MCVDGGGGGGGGGGLTRSVHRPFCCVLSSLPANAICLVAW